MNRVELELEERKSILHYSIILHRRILYCNSLAQGKIHMNKIKYFDGFSLNSLNQPRVNDLIFNIPRFIFIFIQ